MITSLPVDGLAVYVSRQLESVFPDDLDSSPISACLRSALERLCLCLSATTEPRFWEGGHIRFNYLNSDQYAMFLYILSNELFERGAEAALCEKVFFLNKVLYGIDVFYEVQMPRIFRFVHASGTVLGRAHYSDYFCVYQHCTVGGIRPAVDGAPLIYPTLGRHVTIHAGSSVLGACHVGDGCRISAHSLLMNKNLKAGTIYRGTPVKHETAHFPFRDGIWRADPSEPCHKDNPVALVEGQEART